MTECFAEQKCLQGLASLVGVITIYKFIPVYSATATAQTAESPRGELLPATVSPLNKQGNCDGNDATTCEEFSAL